MRKKYDFSKGKRNLYLGECARSKKKPSMRWKAA
jgi:hypothetical protein